VRRSHTIDRRVPLLGWLSMAVGLVSLIHLFYSAWHQDWTYDEPYHLGWSARLLETGETERTSDVQYGSKTPVTLLNAVPFRFAQAHHWGEPMAKFLARLPTIGWWLGLVMATWLFARQYAGEPAAPIAALLVALDPNLAAHGCLVTVDVAYACLTLLCLWAFLKLSETPGPRVRPWPALRSAWPSAPSTRPSSSFRWASSPWPQGPGSAQRAGASCSRGWG
jgi:4-amino-4-deoxy-L-arabinose transferase-like glycosyltransferase